MRKLLEKMQKIHEGDTADEERLFDTRELISSRIYANLENAFNEAKKKYPLAFV